MISRAHIIESFSTLFHARLRSFLAILGIVVGTASVVALMLSSHLATYHALAQFESLGTNLLAMDIQELNFQAQSQRLSKQFTQVDGQHLERSEPQIRMVAPYVNLYEPLLFEGMSYQAQVLGVTPQFATIAKLAVEQGRFISYLDGASYYCVIGETLAKAFRSQGYTPLGQQVLVGNNYFTVIGVLKNWQPNLFMYADINNGVLIPLPTTYLLSKQAQIHNVLFRLIKNPSINVVQQHIEREMTILLPSMQVQFRNPLQIINILGKQRQTFSWLLSAIGSISLLVGGIGVMNIMLVSVIERRREIGIRMAIGASQRDILMMFLVESVMLTIFGGLLGMVIGVFISFVIAKISGWAFFIYKMPLVLGFFLSVSVGVLSGFYPALSASRLDPIQSLHSE